MELVAEIIAAISLLASLPNFAKLFNSIKDKPVTTQSLLRKNILKVTFILVNIIYRLQKKKWVKAREKKLRDTTSPYVVLYYKRKTVSISTSLIMLSLLFLILSAISAEAAGLIRTIVFIYIVLLAINQAVFSYRVHNGYYGCNKYEARKVLKYIMKHRDKNSGNGGRSILVDIETIYECDYPPVYVGSEA